MNKPPLGSATPLRATSKRSSQACRPCRGYKTKCLPSSEPGTCQRCLESGRECIWVEKSQTRKPRAPSRIHQVEEKLDGLVARLVDEVPATPSSRAKSPSTSNRHTITGPETGKAELVEKESDFDQEIADIHAFATQDGEDRESPGDAGEAHEERKNASAERYEFLGGIVMAHESEALYEEYRAMAESFPFVPIPAETTVQQMHDRKPMLLLAILTAASWKDRTKQAALSERYRLELSQRTIFRPRKNVALVQSLLVYLAWYHFYFSHKSQNILPLLHLLIGLARDIGLDQRDKKSQVSKRKRFKASPVLIREYQRTLLGCFYLSAAITTSSAQRLTLIRHNDYISECCDHLHSYGEYYTDKSIPALIDLRKIDQDINDIPRAHQRSQSGDDMATLSMIQSAEAHLMNWRMQYEMQDRSLLLELSLKHADMELHSVALSDTFEEEEETTSSAGLHDSVHWKMLDTCLESARCFLDTLLAYPITEYHLITFTHWMRLPRVVITICKLSFPSETSLPQWDVKMAQDRVRLDLYLDSLCYRMQKLGASPSRPHSIEFWAALQKIMENIRTWYLQKVRVPAPTTAAPSASTGTTPFDSSGSEAMLHSTPASLAFTASNDGVSGCPVTARDIEMISLNAEDFLPPSFDPDRFMDMEFWGGAGSYDPTIYDTGDFVL